MREPYKMFYNAKTGEGLGGYTIRGTFGGEERATKELLAGGNHIPIEDIEVKIEMRGRDGLEVSDLNGGQLEQLKLRYYMEHHPEGVSYGELADINELVTYDEIYEEYKGTIFTEDDFFK